ncbi:hypothetical protein AHF37_02564 [Paragonimus kellicotti]|nr:hypothetical protein AHF37_02564 [Paragonimus kellicotti]
MIPDYIRCCAIVFASFMIVFINDGTMCIIGIYVSYWKEELNVTRFQLDWIGSLQMGLSFCLGNLHQFYQLVYVGPLAGKLIRKFGYRLVTVGGGLISGVSFLICAFTAHLSMLYIFYGLTSGIGFGLAYMSAVVAVTLNFDEKRPLAMGIVSCGTGLGCSVMSLLVPILVEKVGWRNSMYVLSVITASVCVCGTVLTTRKRAQDARRSTMFPLTGPQMMALDPTRNTSLHLPAELVQSSFALQSTWDIGELEKHTRLAHLLGSMGSFVFMDQLDRLLTMGAKRKTSRFHLFKNFQFDLLLIASFIYTLTLMPPIVYLFDRLRQKRFPDSVVSAVISGYGFAGASIRLLVGIIASFNWCKKRSFMLTWVILTGVLSISSNYMKEAWQFGVYSCLLGGAHGAFIVLQPLVLAEIVPKDDLTEGLGIMLLGSGIGYLVGTPLMALVYDYWKNYDACYLACSLIVSVTALSVACIVVAEVKQILMEQYEKRLKRMIEAELSEIERRNRDSSSSL